MTTEMKVVTPDSADGRRLQELLSSVTETEAEKLKLDLELIKIGVVRLRDAEGGWYWRLCDHQNPSVTPSFHLWEAIRTSGVLGMSNDDDATASLSRLNRGRCRRESK